MRNFTVLIARVVSISLSLFLLVSCGNEPEGSASAIDKQGTAVPDAGHHADDAVASIEWYPGSLDEAFAEASASGKPVFLYWGAVWCPPCQEIKHTVFKSQQFIAQSKLFVPVYLDGDTAQAQAAGERFGVKGYPTMIIFNPAGEEVTRIPGGIDISRYNSILALSLEQLRPTRMLIELARTSPEQLQAPDFQQLAFYSWGQDFNALPEDAESVLFAQLAERVRGTDPESSARLYLQYLLMLADEQDDAEKAAADDGGDAIVHIQKADAGPVQTILASPELIVASWEYMSYWADEIVAVLDLTAEESVALKEQWQTAVLAVRQHPALSTAEQLAGWMPYLAFYFSADPAPEALAADQIAMIRAEATAADKKTRNAFARQSVINQINYLYQTAKLVPDARALLMAELDKSASPYYFMSSLAALDEKAGDIDGALEWRRKAYETSSGPATRFQWGAGYVRSMIKLSPASTELIGTTAMALFDDLQGMDEAFAGRNFRILRRLHKDLRTWQAEQTATPTNAFVAFDQRLNGLCQQQVEGSLQAENCLSIINAAALANGE